MRFLVVLLAAIALALPARPVAGADNTRPKPVAAHVDKLPRSAALWRKRARSYKRQASRLGREVRRLRKIVRHEAAYVSKRKRVVEAARRYVGVRYVFGGSGRYGIDCSGLTLAAYRSIGVSLPHLAAAQERLGKPVRGRLLPGDLVFFDYGGHAGIYVGGGDMVEASSARGRVIVQALSTYGLHFDGARRLL